MVPSCRLYGVFTSTCSVTEIESRATISLSRGGRLQKAEFRISFPPSPRFSSARGSATVISVPCIYCSIRAEMILPR